MGVGFNVGLGCLIARRLFIWWPFHPAGYVIGATWSLNLLWLSIFISWATKLIILRFGRLKLHREASAFFLACVGRVCDGKLLGSSWYDSGTTYLSVHLRESRKVVANSKASRLKKNAHIDC